MSIRVSNLVLSLSLAGASLLSGCAGSFDPLINPVASRETPIGEIKGSVHGGQAPVSDAHVYLFAVGVNGYGTNAVSIIGSTGSNVFPDGNGQFYVKTDANGNFALGGDYTCTQGQQIYMVAIGGNPGLTGTVNNTAIVQMAGLGQCPAAGNLAAQVPYLVINEVTTVAFAYAMGGFGSTAYNLSSNAANSTNSATAVANAMANAGNIVNLQWGQAPAVANGNPNSVNPQAKIYALANILGTCVNTSSASSSACVSLFNAAKNSAGVAATDEANAIFNIVHNPANTTANPTHVADIYNLIPPSPVFSYVATPAQPADWTLPVTYPGLVSVPATTGNQITSGPFNIAFDASGNAWIGDRQKGVVEIGPRGASQTFNSGFGMVKGAAVSPIDGTIWVSDYNNNTVDIMDTTGTILSRITTDMNGPILTAFSGNTAGRALAYEADETTTGVVVFDSAAYTLNDFEDSSNFPNIATPGWIAVDNTGSAWIPSTNTTWIGEVTSQEKGKSGNFAYTSSETNGSPNSYTTVSDSNSNIWLASITGTAQLEEITAGNNTVSGAWIGGGMNGPYKLAVDGNNNIWISNAGANTVSGFNIGGGGGGTWLAANGFSTSAPGGSGCVVAAPDPSGNLWSANSDGSVTELLGLAAPTAAPLYGGIVSTGKNSVPGNLGTKP